MGQTDLLVKILMQIGRIPLYKTVNKKKKTCEKNKSEMQLPLGYPNGPTHSLG